MTNNHQNNHQNNRQNHEQTEDFGLWMRRQRQQRNLTQEELARRAGLSPTYISLMERQKLQNNADFEPMPRLQTIDKIAHALDVPINEARLVAGYAAPVTPESNRTRIADEIARLIENMTPEERQKALDIVNILARNADPLDADEIQ